MLILDTCVLIFDSLDPVRLSSKAALAVDQGYNAAELVCCDISLWEIAMLMAKKRINPKTDADSYLQLVLSARKIKVLPITPKIAALSVTPDFCPHGDPADRIIAATAIVNKAGLVTSDGKLAEVSGLQVIW